MKLSFSETAKYPRCYYCYIFSLRLYVFLYILVVQVFKTQMIYYILLSFPRDYIPDSQEILGNEATVILTFSQAYKLCFLFDLVSDALKYTNTFNTGFCVRVLLYATVLHYARLQF